MRACPGPGRGICLLGALTLIPDSGPIPRPVGGVPAARIASLRTPVREGGDSMFTAGTVSRQ